MNWGVTSRTWTAKTPREQALEYETARLQTNQEIRHRRLKKERSLLRQVDQVAAEANRDARMAYNASRYGGLSHHGYYDQHLLDPYYSTGPGVPHMRARGLYDSHMHPARMLPNLVAPGMGMANALNYGAGVSSYLDPAYSIGQVQAHRELLLATERRRRLLAQQELLAQRQMYGSMARVNALGLSPRADYLSTPFMGGYGTDVLATPFAGAGLRTPYVDAYPATPAIYDELAALTVPPGSVRTRHLSTPHLGAIDSVMF